MDQKQQAETQKLFLDAWAANSKAAQKNPKGTKTFGQAAHDLEVAVAELRDSPEGRDIYDQNYADLQEATSQLQIKETLTDPSFLVAASREGMIGTMIAQTALKMSIEHESWGYAVKSTLLSSGNLRALDPYKAPSVIQHFRNEWFIFKHSDDADQHAVEETKAQQEAARKFQSNHDPFGIMAKKKAATAQPS